MKPTHKCDGCGMQVYELKACGVAVARKSREYNLCAACRLPLENLLARKGRAKPRVERYVGIRECDIPAVAQRRK